MPLHSFLSLLQGLTGPLYIALQQDAARELDAARTRTALDAAAKRLMLAKTELKRLEAAGRSA